ncbi:hypothetical protein J7L48_08675 [bacterium]|nr:hypothetical protein [bacterium]
MEINKLREYKFKGKNKKTGEWVYGDLIHKHGQLFIRTYIDGKIYTILVIPETVGQFTGQYDKEGGKIYEGDVINHNTQRNYLVVFDNGCFRIGSNMTELTQGLINHYGFKIIGNIHDTPKLLEATNDTKSKNLG